MSIQTDAVRFTEDHEWLRPDADGGVVVGITDHAQSALGDLVFVQLPAVGSHYDAGDELAVIESVKAAGDIKAPLSGTVVAVNEAIVQDPGKVNSDPLGSGWFVKLAPDEAPRLDGLLTAQAYARLIEG
ncbi:glycine cleavage system protein GcvH [Pigmentiphaga sp. GD03639]|jgi:glycine cleavage system H protein|uniref:Glycine cleavage system H protein n=1 Tax=Pigmentiphaga daeguensis TaxID=414049 RepID=A0ABN1B3C0_9BURK|nr:MULTISPECIES: glycine cleavage system protein GcvH [unclassified Pigmentiphaga]MDH2236840.1 glycine cleavage system protein GcvH [Pigmentiphaga sp. GD03639]OVZ66107.1 glycine cleavage system protein H [Pigmentiphaga sp. NML030171]